MYDIAGDNDDILGLDEILGDDAVLGGNDLAVMGAALSAAGPQGKALLRKFVQNRKMQSSQVMVQRKPRSSGVRPIGFNSANPALVPAGATQNITTNPQELFKGYRLVVPETIAPFFTVNNILVGNKSQFPAATPLPAEGFVPQAADIDLDLETVNPAIDLTLVVTNISGVALQFRAMMTGKQIDV